MGLGEYRIKAYNPTYNFIIGIIFQNTWYKEAKGWGLVSYDPYKPAHNCINYYNFFVGKGVKRGRGKEKYQPTFLYYFLLLYSSSWSIW